VGARFLDHEARAAFKQSVEAIEAASGVEVVIAMRRKSSGYLHANLIVGIVATFVALGAMLFSAHPFSLAAILLDPFIVGAIAAAAVHVLPGVKRLLTPPSVRHRYVSRAAHATFVERGVLNTLDRSGMLVYISWLEQQIALVADSGLARSITPEVITAVERELNAAMPRGGVAVARALESWKSQFAVAVPRRAEDLNELPDDIHSDMEEHHP
jgi:putative membrane protein